MALKKKIKNKIVDYRQRGKKNWDAYQRRKILKNKDFTLIASNCFGARIYQELKMPYNTPFAGLFLFAPCYIKLTGNIDYYLDSKLSFTEKSKYCSDNGKPENKTNIDVKWPIGLLKDDIEIHFQHYKSEDEAKEKWERRLGRMNRDNLFFTFTDRDLCSADHLRQFNNLPFGQKACFTSKPYPDIESAVFLPEYESQPCVGDIYTDFDICTKHFDYIDWLNGGTGKSDFQ